MNEGLRLLLLTSQHLHELFIHFVHTFLCCRCSHLQHDLFLELFFYLLLLLHHLFVFFVLRYLIVDRSGHFVESRPYLRLLRGDVIHRVYFLRQQLFVLFKFLVLVFLGQGQPSAIEHLVEVLGDSELEEHRLVLEHEFTEAIDVLLAVCQSSHHLVQLAFDELNLLVIRRLVHFIASQIGNCGVEFFHEV